MNTTPPGYPGDSHDNRKAALDAHAWLRIGLRVLLGAVLGGIGGAIVGTNAGWAAGPVGALSGGFMGAVMGFFGAGVAVALLAVLRQQTSKRTSLTG